MSRASTYDRIGVGYRGDTRHRTRAGESYMGGSRRCSHGPERRSRHRLLRATDRWVLAVEPSQVMIAQRADAAPVIQATAEDLPLADQTVDAAMAILTLHHWPNLEAGLRELTRVVRDRIVIVTVDVQVIASNGWCGIICLSYSISTLVFRRSTACVSCSETLDRKSPVPRDFRMDSWRRGGRAQRRFSIRRYAPVHPPGVTYPSRSLIARWRGCARISTAETGNGATAASWQRTSWTLDSA